MGYTHNWNRDRAMTDVAWANMRGHVRMIEATAMAEGIALANGFGSEDTTPLWNNTPEDGYHYMNGMADHRCETFALDQQGGGSMSCKTNRMPYDAVVVAILCYLDAEWPTCFRDIESDGWRDEWENGLALAKRALPELADRLEIPEGVRVRP